MKASKPAMHSAAQILAALESDYDDLARDLGTRHATTFWLRFTPSRRFFDVTHAPSWSGAINDGKLRIPVNGLDVP